MQANKIVEMRALLSLRNVYEDGMILKINSGVPKYICLLYKLKGYRSPYFFDDVLECWEGRECKITGTFRLTAENGIDVSNESIRLVPEDDPFIVLLSTTENSLKGIGYELIRRHSIMMKESNNLFFENIRSHNSLEHNIIDKNFTNLLNLDNAFWKSTKMLWSGDCIIVGKDGFYSAIGIEMQLKRTLTSLLVPYNSYTDSDAVSVSKLSQLVVLLTLIIQLVSIIRGIFDSISYLPIFFSTDCILLETIKSLETGIFYFENPVVTDIGEKARFGAIEYSTMQVSDCELLPIQGDISSNKYLTPEISISYFVNSLMKVARDEHNEPEKGRNIYDEFSINTLKGALLERIKNKWKPMIFSGDIKIENNSEFLNNQLFSKDIVDMIINKDVNFIVKIGPPSVVFSIGLLISEIVGGKDLLFVCDGDRLHFVDNLCEWNSCGDVIPIFGRVREENVMNTLTGRRNHSVLDVLPDDMQLFRLGFQSNQLLNKMQKLIWACLSFVPSHRLSLGQLESELTYIKNELFYACRSINSERTEIQTNHTKLKKIKQGIVHLTNKFKSLKKNDKLY